MEHCITWGVGVMLQINGQCEMPSWPSSPDETYCFSDQLEACQEPDLGKLFQLGYSGLAAARIKP